LCFRRVLSAAVPSILNRVKQRSVCVFLAALELQLKESGTEMSVTRKMIAWRAILHQLCPRCRVGRIFRPSSFLWLGKMHERCQVCELKFEREEGYFLGAMLIDYGLGLLLVAILSTLIWLFTRWSLDKTVLAAFLLFLPIVPALTRLGRVLWIYFDQAIDPERR